VLRIELQLRVKIIILQSKNITETQELSLVILLQEFLISMKNLISKRMTLHKMHLKLILILIKMMKTVASNENVLSFFTGTTGLVCCQYTSRVESCFTCAK